jgi:lysophospholipase L1-like esterase
MRIILLVAIAFLALAYTRPLPKLFVIGDSISIQYGPFLEKYFQGMVQYERKEDDGTAKVNLDVPMGANGGDSRMVLAYLQIKIKDPNFKPDYLLLNCGLHDIKRNPLTRTIQVEKNEYRENLKSISKLLKAKHIQLIWMRTTPVVDSIHNKPGMAFFRYDSDVQDYNKIADVICSKNRIPVIDLYGFTKQLGIGQYADHVHYKEETRSLQAAFIAGFIQSYLKTDKNVVVRDMIVNCMGNGTLEDFKREVPENEKDYPENHMFGSCLPSYGLYVRHARNIYFYHIQFNLMNPDFRPAMWFEDAQNVVLRAFKVSKPEGRLHLIFNLQSKIQLLN